MRKAGPLQTQVLRVMSAAATVGISTLTSAQISRILNESGFTVRHASVSAALSGMSDRHAPNFVHRYFVTVLRHSRPNNPTSPGRYLAERTTGWSITSMGNEVVFAHNRKSWNKKSVQRFRKREKARRRK